MSLLFSFYILIVFPFCQSNIFEAFFDALVLAFIDDLQKVSFAVLKAFAVEPRPLARPPPALWGSSRKLKTNELPSGAPSAAPSAAGSAPPSANTSPAGPPRASAAPTPERMPAGHKRASSAGRPAGPPT